MGSSPYVADRMQKNVVHVSPVFFCIHLFSPTYHEYAFL
jgi:hypothetical protein